MIDASIEHPDITARIGLVLVRNLKIGPSPASLADELARLVASRATGEFPPPSVKEGVRALLRAGGFKPAGRNKPASEYLAQAAREGRFPVINNAVDCNNLVSLETGLPISVLDAAAFGLVAGVPDTSPLRIHLRPGDPGESYVFNQSGQEIDLEGLLSVCAMTPGRPDGRPLGNAVKDSMAGKLREDTHDIIGVIYGNAASLGSTDMGTITRRFADLLVSHCGGEAFTKVLGD